MTDRKHYGYYSSLSATRRHLSFRHFLYACIALALLLFIGMTIVMRQSRAMMRDAVTAVSTADVDFGQFPHSLRAALHALRGNQCETDKEVLITSSLTDNNTEHHPNIVHLIRYYRKASDAQLTLLQFLAVLSAERFLEPRAIFFYSNHRPSGALWHALLRSCQCLRWISLPRQRRIGTVRPRFIEHEADYNKVRIVAEQGGIFMDFDALVLNATRLRRLQNLGECVLACEPEKLNECARLNAGFISCRRNSSFMRRWHLSYERDYRAQHWLYNSAHRPMQLYRERLESGGDLPVIVLDTEISQHPAWYEKARWLERKSVNWSNKSVAHHFLKMPEIRKHLGWRMAFWGNDFGLLGMANSLGDVIRHVLAR